MIRIIFNLTQINRKRTQLPLQDRHLTMKRSGTVRFNMETNETKRKETKRKITNNFPEFIMFFSIKI